MEEQGADEEEQRREKMALVTRGKKKRRVSKRCRYFCSKVDKERKRQSKGSFWASLCSRLELELAPEGNRVVG